MNKSIKLILAGLTLSIVASASIARTSPEKPTSFADKQAAWKMHQKMEASSIFRGHHWKPVGPVIQGGRVIDIVNPGNDPFTFYVAFASGGLWKTENNGASFTPLFDQQASMIMGDLAIDPNNPNTIWVGTGEDNSSRSSYGGMGVYRSDDAGKTWQFMGLGDSDRIGRIVIDPRDSNRIYVATLGKLYTNGGQRGVYRSIDGGKTWKRVLKGANNKTGFVDLIMHPKDPDVLYASSWERTRKSWDFVEGGKGSAVWKSTDGGDTWRKVVKGLPQGKNVGRIGLAISQSKPDTLYLSLDNQNPAPAAQADLGGALSVKRVRNMSEAEFLRHSKHQIESFIQSNDLETNLDADLLTEKMKSGELSIQDLMAELGDANDSLFNTDIIGLEVYRSDDGGENWFKPHTESLLGVAYTYAYYFGQIQVSPENHNKVYVLGLPFVTSDDGGKNWYGLTSPNVHVDYQAMWINPENPRHFIVGNDGGVDVTHDRGKTWHKMDRIPVGQFYTVNVDNAEPFNIIGGLQDNGTLRGPSNADWKDENAWESLFGGDGMYAAIDPRDNKTTYLGYQFGHYFRKDPNGAFTNIRPRDNIGESALRYNWNTPVVLSPHNPDVVYFGANKLFRSFNKGNDWTAISPDLTTSKKRGNVSFATLTSISESPLEFGKIWIGTDDGNVKLTVDGGLNWKNVAKRLPKDRWVSRVEASPHDVNTAYVSLNGYRNDDNSVYLFKTTNNGKSWKNIGKQLPKEAVNVIKEDPNQKDLLYVGTDRGVYVSFDQGDSWMSLDGGLPNVPVHDLAIQKRDKKMVAGTHGRSIWMLDLAPLYALNSEVKQKAFHFFDEQSIQASHGWLSKPNKWFDWPEYKPKHTFELWSKQSGSAKVSISTQEGMLLKSFEVALIEGVNQFEWDLLVDLDKALEAEKQKLAGKELSTLNKEEMPVHEIKRLGYPMYIVAGEYKLTVERDGQVEEISLTVNKAPDAKPRVKRKPTVRGKK